MINFNKVTGKNTRKQNPCWSHFLDHSYKTLRVQGYTSGKTNAVI